MGLVFEEFYRSIPKAGEEVCGDNVEIIKKENKTIIVLSDGLGSGIKANILSTLTSKIASGLLDKELPLKEILSTILATLPVCEVRGIAYATLAFLIIDQKQQLRLIEIDTPSAFLFRNNQVKKLEYQEFELEGKKIKEANFKFRRQDQLFLVSDGVTHAGIGGLLNFGLGWNGVAEEIERTVNKNQEDLKDSINNLVKIFNTFYGDQAGDDFTIIGMKYRKKRKLNIWSGPPLKKADDKHLAQKIHNAEGKKVISGGTTAQIASRELDEELEPGLEYYDKDIPPTSKMKGFDLLTEGLLTLNKVLSLLKKYKPGQIPVDGKDGASRFTRLLLESDSVQFFVGRAVNESHQSLNLPINLGIRSQIISQIAEQLRRIKKEVKIEWF
ncbi:stage II sporulation protein E [Halanaerobium saccharolyticum]|uniref:Stage II sporulation protein E n=1 Tax=Halanaerobium saccharolyticum TaxID=43595 RepID=A0A4R7YVN2_9FIRM|nr:SpoIIE family protein phosphatase [Halanaerobium saccharolyticum]RAK07113.1 stage II sporulation protein E [Halanaerobium saccharolyticum]TDW01875.1 stage II sporulation protein E [Halanaerobium saccharolyticum]TDX53121.1 stage II sporulation protein E [Halanaerobium saccharolyticum]